MARFDWESGFTEEQPFLKKVLPEGRLLVYGETGPAALGGLATSGWWVDGVNDLDDLGDDRFEAVFCVVDVLAALHQPNEMESALYRLFEALRPGGRLLAANVNDDRRWRERPRFEPARQSREAKSERIELRFFDYFGSYLLRHETVLNRAAPDEPWREFHETVRRRPVFEKDLRNALTLIGFTDILLWGSWREETFDPKRSPLLLMSGARR